MISEPSVQNEKLTAYAKINLHLKVYPPRADGYHPITSIFQKISLGDTIYPRRLAGEGTCIISGRFNCPPEDNLIYKAWRAFSREIGVAYSWDFRVEKCIPAGAGLGGGSSDAASVLAWLNRIHGAPLSLKELSEIGAAIGADVPFFLFSNAALVRGIGERITPLPAPDAGFIVIVKPEIHVNTGEAYRLLDTADPARNEPEDPGTESLLHAFGTIPPRNWPFFNSFTPVISRSYPVIQELIKSLYSFGAEFCEMSGSGSAVFGIFREESQATAALNRFSPYHFAWKGKMLADS